MAFYEVLQNMSTRGTSGKFLKQANFNLSGCNGRKIDCCVQCSISCKQEHQQFFLQGVAHYLREVARLIITLVNKI